MQTHASGHYAALFGAVLSLVGVLPALAATSETPQDFVHRVYARYRNDGPGVPMARPDGAPFYSAALLDAFAKDQGAGGAGSIDWDPVCNCQTWENLRITSVAVTAKQADTVVAKVAIANLGSTRIVRLTLSRTPDGWRIADVGEKGAESIVDLLRKAATR